jgi:transposase
MFDSNSVWVGVDVASRWIDVCLLEGEQQHSERIARQDKPLARWAAALKAKQVQQVVLEATGGYEQLVVEKLQAEGLAVSVVNPRRVRDFAKAAGLLAKTDQADAYALALFARRMQPRLTPSADPARLHLRLLVQRRQQLVRMRASERTRLRRNENPLYAASCGRIIELLADEIGSIEQQMSALVDNSPQLTLLQTWLRSVPGVGPNTSWTLLAQLPELGTLDAKRIASLAGLAPFARDSGQSRGQRRIAGGRKLVRQMLYMAARTAVRRDLRCESFYRSLLDRGKRPQVALIAVARKLLVTLNAIVRDQRPWLLPVSALAS